MQGLRGRKACYISAKFPNLCTVQGPPSSLDTLQIFLAQNHTDSQKGSGKRLPIYTPYHAHHLYSEAVISQILNGPGPNVSTLSSNSSIGRTSNFLSPLTGALYSFDSRSSLLEQILKDVLLNPIDWEKVTTGCIDFIKSSPNEKWVLQPFGPTIVAQGLASLLSAQTGVEMRLQAVDRLGEVVPAHSGKREPIAIVGMAGRFPGSMNHDELWRLLEQGIDCNRVVGSIMMIGIARGLGLLTCYQVPADRFDAAQHSIQNGAKNPIENPHGCFLKDPGMFDARFFHLSPREAAQTDPQQRLALTTAHEALEMSGFVPNRTPSTKLERIGTYYGQTADDYREANACQDIQTYYVSGNDRAFGPVSRAYLAMLASLMERYCTGPYQPSLQIWRTQHEYRHRLLFKRCSFKCRMHCSMGCRMRYSLGRRNEPAYKPFYVLWARPRPFLEQGWQLQNVR